MIILQLDKLTSAELDQLASAIHVERLRRFTPIPLLDTEKLLPEIAAIKAIKQRVGCSLVEAKWSVDSFHGRLTA